MTVNSVNPNSEVKIVPSDEIGFAGMKSEDFLKILISQLQNQDPMEPTGNEEIIGQLTSMQQLQASTEMQDAISSLTTSQEYSASADLIGRGVMGQNANGESVTGVVQAVLKGEEGVLLDLGFDRIDFDNVQGIFNLDE